MIPRHANPAQLPLVAQSVVLIAHRFELALALVVVNEGHHGCADNIQDDSGPNDHVYLWRLQTLSIDSNARAPRGATCGAGLSNRMSALRTAVELRAQEQP
jgi:hypothetical protein